MVAFLLPLTVHAEEETLEGALLKDLIKNFNTQSVYFIVLHPRDMNYWTTILQPLRNSTYLGMMKVNELKNIRQQFTTPQKTILVGKAPNDLSTLVQLLEDPVTIKMKWVLFLQDTQMSFKGTFIPFHSEFLVVSTNMNETTITEIYQMEKDYPLIKKQWGTWNKKTGLDPPNQELFTRRQNLQGHNFRLAAYRGTRFDPDQIYMDKMIGFIADSMNFTFTSKYWELGVLDQSGSTTGVYKALIEGQVDIASLPFVVTPLRLQKLTMLWTATVVKTYLFVTVQEEQDWASYLKPFDIHLWCALAAWAGISFISFWFMHKMKYKIKSNVTASAEALIQAVSPYCGQGVAVSSKTVMFICLLMPYINSLVLLPAYSGAILSFLAVPLRRAPFKDMNGFIEDGTFKLSFIKDTYTDIYFTTSENEEAKLVRRKNLLVLGDGMPKDAEAGFHQMCTNGHLVYIDSVAPEPSASCYIIRLEELLDQPLGIAVKSGFPYQQLATRMMRRVHYSGLMKIFQEVRMPQPPEFTFKPLEIDSVVPLFLTFATLTFFALMGFALELCFYKQPTSARINYKSFLIWND